MIGGIAVLLAFQLLGEVIVITLGIPIPGPVVGMLLLFASLLARGTAPVWLKTTGHGLLRYLSLLFVPAGAGVLAHFSLIAGQVWAIAATLVVSTIVTMAVTALVMQFVLRRGEPAGALEGQV